MSQSRTFAKILCAAAAIALIGSHAHAQTLSVPVVVNNSSPDPVPDSLEFHTSSSISPVVNDGLRSSVVHRMAFRNMNSAAGTVAQVNKRNVTFEISFTVEDPDNQGFVLEIKSFMQGISGLNWTSSGSGAGTAGATGLNYIAEYDDSTDIPDSFEVIAGITGAGTEGVTLTEPGVVTELQSDEAVAYLGPYVGTTDFVFLFNSQFSPTTNVFFPNNVQGVGAVVYGMGSVPPGFGDLTPSDLGHFLTFTAAFGSPCPGDVTGDGTIDLADLNLVLANFGSESLDGDTNIDGVVDLADLNTVLAAFGATCD